MITFLISRRTLIVVSIIILLTGIYLQSLDARLETKYAQNGMTSLTSSWDFEDAAAIRSSWQKTVEGSASRIHVGITYLIVDSLLFVFCYGMLLYHVLLRSGITRGVVLMLPALAMISDLTENFLAISFLQGADWSQVMIPFLSLTKIVCIVLSIFFMRSLLLKVSDYTNIVVNILWTFRIIVISLLALYLVLWQSDQGQDLLINLNSNYLGVGIFLVSITVVAALHWHLPKFLSTQTDLIPPKNMKEWFHAIVFKNVSYKELGGPNIKYIQDSDLARGFGVATFLIPAFGILNVMDKFQLTHSHPNVLLLVAMLVTGLALNYNWIDNAYAIKAWKIVFHAVLILGLAALVVLGLVNETYPSLVWLFIALMVLAVMFLTAVSIRRHLGIVGNIRIAPLIMSFAGIFALFFIGSNFLPLDLASAQNESIRYSTISVFLCGLVFYILFFSMLIFWGRVTQVVIAGRLQKVNVAGIFLALSILFAMYSDNRFHDVNLEKKNAMTSIPERPDLSAYFKQWLAHRDTVIMQKDSSDRFPIFVVNAYGGGIRAAAWTSFTINFLDDAVQKHTGTGENFQDHVFAYSGASGGTIGAAVMCALRKTRTHVKTDSLVSFYRKDFLSPVVIGLIGRDFFASTFGLTIDDRAVLQEEIWEKHMATHFNNHVYEDGISDIWKQEYDVPLLFANTTQVERGVKGVVAPVGFRVSDFPSAVSVVDSIYKQERERCLENSNDTARDVKLSTSAFFSARFPFISPAGRVNGSNHFLDGGIYENSGAETAAEIVRVLDEVLAEMPAIRNKVKIIVLSLKNSPPYVPGKAKKNLFELSAPLKAVVENVDGNAIHADSVNAVLFKGRYHRLFPSLPKDGDEADLKAILPLGWQLSDNALRRLKKNLTKPEKEAHRTIKNILREF